MNKYKAKELVSMVDYVLLRQKEWNSGHAHYLKTFKKQIINYANLLNQKPTLGMFVPCDEEGNVLTNPEKSYDFDSHNLSSATEEYQQAQGRVIFEGWECLEFDKITEVFNEDMGISIYFEGDEIGSVRYPENPYEELTTIEDLTRFKLKLK